MTNLKKISLHFSRYTTRDVAPLRFDLGSESVEGHVTEEFFLMTG